MVELFDDWLDEAVYLTVISQKAGTLIDVAIDLNFHTIAMTVKVVALVIPSKVFPYTLFPVRLTVA